MSNSKISTILEAIEIHSQNVADKLCLADIDKNLNYGDTWKAIVRSSSYFKEAGIKSGDKVILRGGQKVEYIVAFFGLHLAGAVVCPVERVIKGDRILEIMNSIESQIYVTDKKVKQDSIRQLSLEEIYSFATDDSKPLGGYIIPDPNSIAEILFTTGTTGKSKGIIVSHKCDVSIAQNVIDSVEMTDSEVEVITTPTSHSLAIRRIFGAMYIGSSLVLSDGVRYAQDFLKLCTDYRATALTFVPAILEQLLLVAKSGFERLNDQIRYIQLGSAPLSESNKAILCEMFPNSRLYNTYGATESGCTIVLEFSKYKNKKNCIGRTTVNTKILFVDDDRNVVNCSEQSPALLAFSGGMNMEGYYNETELTAEVLDANGVVYTNDIGYLGTDGLVYLLGRRGEVINVGGIKVAPIEIEEVAVKFDGIKDCACVPIDDDITGKAVKMFVELEDGSEFDEAGLIRFLSLKLEKLKIPKKYEVIDKIPRTFNGKIVRKELI